MRSEMCVWINIFPFALKKTTKKNYQKIIKVKEKHWHTMLYWMLEPFGKEESRGTKEFRNWNCRVNLLYWKHP